MLCRPASGCSTCIQMMGKQEICARNQAAFEVKERRILCVGEWVCVPYSLVSDDCLHWAAQKLPG